MSASVMHRFGAGRREREVRSGDWGVASRPAAPPQQADQADGIAGCRTRVMMEQSAQRAAAAAHAACRRLPMVMIVPRQT